MTKAPKDPNAPTLTQEAVLAEAVKAAFDAGWKGKHGAEHTPVLNPGTYYRVGVPEGTRKAAERRGLVERVQVGEVGTRSRYVLTALGIKVGMAYYEKRHGVNPKKVARDQQARQKKRRDEQKARTKRAKHLFRGLHMARGPKGPRSISSAISENGEVRLGIDDLLVLGEEIEKLRAGARS